MNRIQYREGAPAPPPGHSKGRWGMSLGPALLPWARSSHTHPSLPWPALSPRGGGGVPEVRSPQLSKSSAAQLPGINTTSWAPLRRDHTSSPSQLLSCSLPTQAPHPQRPLLTHAALPSQGPARTLPLPWQARRGALQWKGQERSEAPPENSRTHKNPGTPRCDAK